MSRHSRIPTVEQVVSDRISQIAYQYWSIENNDKHLPFDAKVVEDIYANELRGTDFSVRRQMLLEFSQYLESYLWPNFSQNSTVAHVISVVCMVNEKFRERAPAWDCFVRMPDQFPIFFVKFLNALLGEANVKLSFAEQTQLLRFLDNSLNSLETTVVRNEVQKLLALTIWTNLLPSRRQELLTGRLLKIWNAIWKKEATLPEAEQQQRKLFYTALNRLIDHFLEIVESVSLQGEIDENLIEYCNRFMELLIDLEALLPARRFFNSLLQDKQIVIRCAMGPLVKRPEGHLFTQLLDQLKLFAGFEIDDMSGEQLNQQQTTERHYKIITKLQKAAYKLFPAELKEFYLLNVASVDTRKSMSKHFGRLTDGQLYELAEAVGLMPPLAEAEGKIPKTREFLLELLISMHERKQTQLQYINELALYPTEEVTWDKMLVPDEFYSGQQCLALPKIGLQFLTIHDYLLRNFNLYRLESTFQIRGDLEDAVFRMKPWRHETGQGCIFGGWARMALPIVNFGIVEVTKPDIGERSPAMVRADVTLALNVRPEIRSEWENLRRHDVCFLLTLRPKAPFGTRYDIHQSLLDQIEVTYVRGCEIEGMLDEDGRVIEEWQQETSKPKFATDRRTWRVFLDQQQYRIDLERTLHEGEDVYGTFNVLLRRNPKENNFKAVLDTIRKLMNVDCVVPEWLHELILGFGKPEQAHYANLKSRIPTIDFNDTFLNWEHLKSSFDGYQIKVKKPDASEDEPKLYPPFRLTFHDLEGDLGAETKKEITVEPYTPPNRGPYKAQREPKRNRILFTPMQIEAIKSGTEPGLTMVVGPPGTGKTDVAVQIISNIYHNWPEQRTLLVTHSNQALNQLFQKIMALDIDERHLLRMGHGEEALETEKDFSAYGRVNYVLAKRLELLQEVERLQRSLDVPGDLAYTCETAQHFFLYQVQARWENFQTVLRQTKIVDEIANNFPFAKFFEDAPQPLFKRIRFDEDLEIANGCWRYIRQIFQQLDEFRAFELLRTGRERVEYLLVKEAKIIAMTCTHAALRRADLVRLGFKFDNILMEEAAQILEVETFIPLLLQNPQDGRNRLKRWIMIGDHHQLPPIIQNLAFQKYSNLEQSMFARLVRLGVPTVLLDAQGRARASLASLYNWRYPKLTDLPHVLKQEEFRRANAGFVHDFQLINVPDFHGQGEATPAPHFFQNLAEAEFAVAIFMYMRMLGYPAEKISILTTYNGQKHLLRDVVTKRCSENPMFGEPHKINTVDKYQGQQNDYIILSLVRTRSVGHLRDVRRLIVAMSRARLGLYILARVKLFANCFELTPAFNILRQRPLKLLLCPNEHYPTERRCDGGKLPMDPIEISDMPHMCQFVFDMYNHEMDKYMSKLAKERQATKISAADAEVAAKIAPYKEGGKVEDVPPVVAEEEKKIAADIEFEVFEEEEAPAPRPSAATVNGQSSDERME